MIENRYEVSSLRMSFQNKENDGAIKSHNLHIIRVAVLFFYENG